MNPAIQWATGVCMVDVGRSELAVLGITIEGDRARQTLVDGGTGEILRQSDPDPELQQANWPLRAAIR